MINLTREEAKQVPLVEQLESVPRDARLCIDDADGMGTHYFPIGNMCHEAAKAIRAKLAQETPYEIGKRLYQEGKGISFIPTAVPHDDNIAEALRGFEDARVAQPEPEPVAWVDWDEHGDAFLTIKDCGVPLYTAPPQRGWVGLTDYEVDQIEIAASSKVSAIYLAEPKLKEKNT